MSGILKAALLVTVLVSNAKAKDYSFFDLGMDMSVRAYDAVCWYDTLVQFPNTHSNSFPNCQGQALSVQKQISSDDDAKNYFGQWMIELAMGGLDPVYSSKCNDYLLNSDKAFPVDQSETLNDANNNHEAYPFRGFSFCMLTTLKEKQGEKALQTVRQEMTVTVKNWRGTILDRDNAFRSLHGVSPFHQNDDLNKAAQQWADTMASECNLFHSDQTGEGRQLHGESTGESIASGGGDVGKSVAAYIASDGWYEEVKDYPFQTGFTGGDDDLFHKIGHFTQTVWKGTTDVGYGFAYNADCSTYNWYIAARYLPAGNTEGEYQNNVFLPQNQ